MSDILKADETKVEHEPHELFCPHCNPCRHREKLNEYDGVLRALCSFLAAGGYNVTHMGLIGAKSADEKIRWGIDHIMQVETKRREAAEQRAAEATKRAEAMERDARLRQSIGRAAAELPDGCEIQITVERGAATVEWFDKEGRRYAMDIDSDRRLEAEFDAAIDAAIEKESRG